LKVIVTTTGTSLLTNASSFISRYSDMREKMPCIAEILERAKESHQRPERAILSYVSNEEERLKGNRRELEKFERGLENDLLTYLTLEDEKAASAELNTLRTMEEKSSGKGEEEIKIQKGESYFIFLHSDTLSGRVCAKAISKHLERKGVHTHLVNIKGLNYESGQFLGGLNSFVSTLTKIVQEYRERRYGERREIIFCATAGFKAELALANLVGQVFGVSVYYLHELFKDTVVIPPLPLKPDPEFWNRYGDFLEWIQEKPRTEEEIQKKYGSQPRELFLLLHKVDDRYQLSPAGHIIIQYFKESPPLVPEITEEFEITAGKHRVAPSLSRKRRVSTLSDITNQDARLLLLRAKNVGAKKVIFNEFSKSKKSETYLKIEKINNNELDCTLYCDGFAQKLTLITPSRETARYAHQMLGEKNYP